MELGSNRTDKRFNSRLMKTELLYRFRTASARTVWRLAREISALGDNAPVKDIVSILRTGRHTHTRAAAAWLLGLVGNQGAVPHLENTLANKNEVSRVRGYAAEALAHLHRKETANILIDRLSDPSRLVRFWCIFALGEMGVQRAVPFLREISHKDKRIVRGHGTISSEAQSAIRRIRVRA